MVEIERKVDERGSKGKGIDCLYHLFDFATEKDM